MLTMDNYSMYSVVLGPEDDWQVNYCGRPIGQVSGAIAKEDVIPLFTGVLGDAVNEYSGSRSSDAGLQAGEVAEYERQASDTQIGGTHYKSMAIQPSEFIRSNGLGWHEGNAIKYICRHSIKNGKQDIDKAIHYLELLKELEYDEETELPDPPF